MMQTQLPAVEGITPDILWYTIVGLVGIGALIILVDKVADVWRKHQARKAVQQTPSAELADTIAKKVLNDLEPRFEAIDTKLANDKTRLDAHERALSHISETEASNREGFAALCGAMIAVLDHELHNGNAEQMEKARDELNHYLTHKK